MPRAQARQRLQVGKAWQDNDLVFATSVGTPLDAANVRRSFRRITKAAGLAENWTPRELRHSFVSIMNDNGVTIEQIADLVGHKTTIVTQKVYRHQLKPVISTGATAQPVDRSQVPGMRRTRKPVRSVAHLPELLSASYRNRVRKLSPGNQNQGVRHLPGSHTPTCLRYK